MAYHDYINSKISDGCTTLSLSTFLKDNADKVQETIMAGNLSADNVKRHFIREYREAIKETNLKVLNTIAMIFESVLT